MDANEFEAELRRFLRTEPFEPFVIENLDGRAVLVDFPSLVFDGGGAMYASEDQGFIFFNCEDVRAIRPAPAEAVP